MKILVLNYHPHTHLGGAEIQCDILASQWTQLGQRVVYGALDARHSDFEQLDVAYEIAAVPNRSSRALLEVLMESQPDIVYWRAGRAGLVRAASLAKFVDARFVFAIVAANHVNKWSYTRVRHDETLASTLKYGALRAVEALRYRVNFEAYRLVDGLVSNTRTLLQQAPTGTGITTVKAAIYNAMVPVLASPPFVWTRPYIVWVANLTRMKNPEKYVEAARQLRDLDVDFLMVGQINHAHFEWVAERHKVPDNFHYLGPRTPEEVNTILSGALLLVHTCDPEGFPGNFVQAWWQGIPTLTLYYDPDGVIVDRGVGRLAGTLERLVTDIRDLVGDNETREAMGARALALARSEFAPETNARQYLDFFQDVLGQRRS